MDCYSLIVFFFFFSLIIMSANDMTILFKTSDNKTLTVSKATLQCSKFVCHLMEEIDATNAEPIVVDLPNISHSTLLRIVEFAEHEVKQQTAAGGLPASVTGTRSTHAETIELSPWEEQFCKVDQKTLFDIMMVRDECIGNPLSLP